LKSPKFEIFWKNWNNSSNLNFEVLNSLPIQNLIYWQLKFEISAKKKDAFFGYSIFSVELRFGLKCPKVPQKWLFWHVLVSPSGGIDVTLLLVPFETQKT